MKKLHTTIALICSVSALGLVGCAQDRQVEIIAKYVVPEHDDNDEKDFRQPTVVILEDDPVSLEVSWECYDSWKVGDMASKRQVQECKIEYEEMEDD